ncbi:MAG: hypothetical protein IJM27_11670 [Eubacterium sp.]|nr:hypothetical protein [Eubacterium sp.]
MKIVTGIGVTALCAMLAAVPAFGYANALELDVNGSAAVAETTTEQTDTVEELKGVTEEEATEILGEASAKEEAAELPGKTDAKGDEKTVTIKLEDADVIPADGINGSFVSKYQDVLPVEWSEELCEELYNMKAVCYQDENLSRLAVEYLDQGYYLSDLKKEGEVLGAGIGYEDYYFNSGFCAVDDMTGNNSFITYVAKIAQMDFDKFVAELGDHWTKKSATEYSCNDGVNDATVTYDPATGILIYTNDFTDNAEG